MSNMKIRGNERFVGDERDFTPAKDPPPEMPKLFHCAGGCWCIATADGHADVTYCTFSEEWTYRGLSTTPGRGMVEIPATRALRSKTYKALHERLQELRRLVELT